MKLKNRPPLCSAILKNTFGKEFYIKRSLFKSDFSIPDSLRFAVHSSKVQYSPSFVIPLYRSTCSTPTLVQFSREDCFQNFNNFEFINHSGLGSIWIQTGPTLVPVSVTCGKYQPDPILCRLGLNFDGADRLFTVPGLSMAYFTYPTWLVQCEIFVQLISEK